MRTLLILSMSLIGTLLSTSSPTLASGTTKTEEACRKLGGEPLYYVKSEKGYYCRTEKLDKQCERKHDSCWAYEPKTGKCEEQYDSDEDEC